MHKEKKATRGQRQIHDENQSTLLYYSVASATTSAICVLLNYFVFSSTNSSWFGLILTSFIQLCAVSAMRGMMKSVRNEKNQIIDAGSDLNDPEAFGEYCKDAVILGCITHALSFISVYFYFLLLCFPVFLLVKLWKSVIYPWLTYSPPEADDAAADKKQKKREKKIYIRH